MDAPATIIETVELLENNYGLAMPLVDLFYWGTDSSGSGDITDAVDLGATKIGQKDCEHFAFRQPTVDWQLWIETGKEPLPCKFVITTVQDDAKPQFSAVLTWTQVHSSGFRPTSFVFVPPSGAKRVAIVPLAGASVKN